MTRLQKDTKSNSSKDIMEAQKLLKDGDYAEAEALFEKAIEPYKNLSTLGFKAYAKAIFKGLRERRLLAEAYYGLGLCAINEGALKEGVNRLRLASESFEKEKMYVEQAKCYSAMGDAYRVAFDLDIAEEMYRAAMKLNIKHKSYEALAGDYINIGVVYNARERYDVALSWYNDAINIGEKIDSLLCKAIALKKIALCYQQQCNLPKAINKYNLAYKAYAEIGNYDELAQICADTAFIVKNANKLGFAEKLANKAILYADKGGMAENKFMALIELGDIHSRKNDFINAESSYSQAIKIMKDVPNANLSVAYSNLGCLYLKNNQLDEAEKMFHASLNLEQKDKRNLSVGYDFANIGMVELKRGNLDKACNNWHRAKKYFAEAGDDDSFNEMQSLLDDYATDDMVFL